MKRGVRGFSSAISPSLNGCRLQAVACNAVQRTATHCNTLQHTTAHCNALQRTATHCNTLQHKLTFERFPQFTVPMQAPSSSWAGWAGSAPSLYSSRASARDDDLRSVRGDDDTRSVAGSMMGSVAGNGINASFVLQCVAVCCSVLQCVAGAGSMVDSVTVE